MKDYDKGKKSYVKATREGRLYMENSAFFKQKKIQSTIKDLLQSDIIREMEERNKVEK